MKKSGFLLFGGEDPPSGGWKDLIGWYGSEDHAMEDLALYDVEWWHLVDLESGQITSRRGK